MPLVLFANTKGGSGKTTAALVFAGEVLKHGAKLILFEGDPTSRWPAGPAAGACP
jgi:cellulose biosynthesis protein BcsQ